MDAVRRDGAIGRPGPVRPAPDGLDEILVHDQLLAVLSSMDKHGDGIEPVDRIGGPGGRLVFGGPGIATTVRPSANTDLSSHQRPTSQSSDFPRGLRALPSDFAKAKPHPV
jgi:hypothetical protein